MAFKDSNGQIAWEPNKKQAQFLAIPTSIREAFYGGGAGSGKSEVLLMYPIVHGWHEHPSFKQVFMRRTYPELKNEIMPRSRLIYPKFGGEFNKTDMTWTFPSGAVVMFGHCEHEDDVHQYDSMEINLFSPDELTSDTWWIYSYIGFTRVRSGSRDLPAIIRATGMPGNIGHGWVKERFVDPCPQGGKVIVGKGGNKRIFIHATLADNRENFDAVNYAQGLEVLPEAEKRAKLFGDWGTYEGQVFDEFRDKHYPSEPDNAMHLVSPFAIPDHWPRICAIDWGFTSMCSIGWAAISPNKKVYIYRHQWFVGKKIEEWGPLVKQWVDKDKPLDIVICHSAQQHRGDPHSIIEQVSAVLEQPIRLGERDRISGKQLVHEYLRWKLPEIPEKAKDDVYDDELAKWIMRNKGENEYKKYLQSFQPQLQDSDIPRLLFFSDDKDVGLICDALKACNYAREGRDGKKQEDVAEFRGDDPYDMLRMLLHAADRFFDVALTEQQKVTRVERIIDQFQRSQDMTQYYRNLRAIEAMERVVPVKRFHHGNHYGIR